MSSPFLALPSSSWIASNPLAFAIHDRNPVSPGHTLVIPRRLVATWFDATPDEQAAIFDLVNEVKRRLDDELHPDGYNIGINAGEAAGQTVMHLHVHVIPRYRGDVDDPRGGVRHVIPGKGNYLLDRSPPLAQGGLDDPFLAHLDPLFRRATDIAILAAFTQERGLDVLETHVFAALARGAHIRLVTSDYLYITQASALKTLVNWMGSASALADADSMSGQFEARIVEVSRMPKGIPSFHPKSWRFAGPGFGTAFVGSSNISQPALGAGIEWNLRVNRARDPEAYQAIVRAFERWWGESVPLSSAWIDNYEERIRSLPSPALPPGREQEDLLPPAPEPHQIQLEALTALRKSREQGHCRALVVLATGLGKTWLAAFDVSAWGNENGNLPRVLVLAHREELLVQAAKTFRRQLRAHSPSFGWCVGDKSDLGGKIVFASVQKLSRTEHLARLEPNRFDYVVVDEVHHGTAPTYRKIIDRLQPRFLLGLTATPERIDGADVAGLFDDHIAYRADLGVGIQRGFLVPFAYFGLRDDTKYEAIPFRNYRFEPRTLESSIDTDARLERMYRAWQEHPAERTLIFCCSIRHADHTSAFLTEHDVPAAAVHSGATSASRQGAIADLLAGKIQALCVVDLFNEGIDIPEVDRVIMLRPTESPVVFLQQLGRGLRVFKGKTRLVVLDFVGNHRVFLERVRTLISLGPEPTDLRDFLENKQAARVAPGCTVEIEIEAKDLLRSMLSAREDSLIVQVYRDLKAIREQRPTAGELRRMGYPPSTLPDEYDGWFDFMAREGDLDDAQGHVLDSARTWFHHIESVPSTQGPRLLVLEVLLEAGVLFDGMHIDTLAHRCRDVLMRFPELAAESEKLVVSDPGHYVDAWKKGPLAAWTESKGRRFFVVEGDRFVPRIPCPEGHGDTLATMTAELLDERLAACRGRLRQDASGTSFTSKVMWNKRDPILKLPSRKQWPDLPFGWEDVRLPDGAPWQFAFVQEYCNVARPAGSQRNALPDLLRRWFGPSAGRPGTDFRVRFSRSPDGWWIGREERYVATHAERGILVAFPTLRAAAGAAQAPVALAPEGERVRLPTKARGEGLFAVRATGESMDGGKEPIRHGDWLVMRFARGISRDAIAGKIALVEVPDPDLGASYLIKRVIRNGKRWLLRSDNPAHPSIEATAETVPIATLVEVVKPETLGPSVGATIDDDALADAFGLSEPPRTGRVDGHLFFLIEAKGMLVAPDRIRFPNFEARPGEIAFILTRAPGESKWRYAGVAEFIEGDGLWACADIDFPTFRALGEGREASRTLPQAIEQRARLVVDELLRDKGLGAIIEREGKRLRLVGPAKRGGLRIDGGPFGFKERTISLTDIGWVLVAQDHLRAHPGILNETLVHHLRYVQGTPPGSTRWIDTGWAIVIVEEALARKA